MPQKFIALVSGYLTEIIASIVSTGAPDAGKIPALDASGKLDPSFMPVGVVPEVRIILSPGALSAGNLVNIYNNAGTPNVRKADASNNYEVHGFVLAAVLAGANATVYLEGVVTGLSGLTPGAKQFLSATPGAATPTPPTTSGYMSQQVGVAVDATTISFEPAQPVTLA